MFKKLSKRFTNKGINIKENSLIKNQFLLEEFLDLIKRQPIEWLNYFKNSSVNQFNKYKIVINRISTDSEICNLFELSRLNQIKQDDFKEWENQLRIFSPKIGENKLSYKKYNYFYRDFTLSHYKADKYFENNLFIGFTGNASLLMSPLPCVIDTLKRLNFDLILVHRNKRISYFDENQLIYLKVEKIINKIIYSNNYNTTSKKLFTIGTSAAALPSLVFAIRNSLKLGIYIGGSSNDFDILSSLLFDKNSNRSFLLPNVIEENISKLLLLAGDECVKDKKKINFVGNYFKEYSKNLKTEISFLKGCKEHDLIFELIKKGESDLMDLYINMINQSI